LLLSKQYEKSKEQAELKLHLLRIQQLLFGNFVFLALLYSGISAACFFYRLYEKMAVANAPKPGNLRQPFSLAAA
jgi:hypothetical protein